jgi:4-hydroxyproline epimerase
LPGPNGKNDVASFTSNRSAGYLGAVQRFTDPQFARMLAINLKKEIGGKIPASTRCFSRSAIVTAFRRRRNSSSAARCIEASEIAANVMYDNPIVLERWVEVIDSHTEGEPTRVVIAGGPDLGTGDLSDRLKRFEREFDHFRRGIVCEPRGSEVVVGALLCQPVDPESAAAVIFFNDVGYLGMCGHGAIGLITTLAHMGRIGPGQHQIETPVGTVSTLLHTDGRVSVTNVPSYRFRASIPDEVPGLGRFTGDIAWGGNWFFLIGEHPFDLSLANRTELVIASTAIRFALIDSGITGEGGAVIDHIEFFAPPRSPSSSSRNFVLCPGASFDRSPCGTGTSAKMACLYADGKLAPGDIWIQEGILGTFFEGRITGTLNGRVHPEITGQAWVTAESKLLFQNNDPFVDGIPF